MNEEEYRKASLELLERIASGIEELNRKGVVVQNFVLPAGSELQVMGDMAVAGPAGTLDKADAE